MAFFNKILHIVQNDKSIIMTKTEEERTEKAVFIGIIRQNDDERKVVEYLDELEFLAETAGAIGDKKFVQRLDKPEKSTYIRSGKLQEIADYCEDNNISYAIFDDELTGMKGQRLLMRRCRSSSPGTTTCYLGLLACGPTLRDKEVEWGPEAVWVRPR